MADIEVRILGPDDGAVLRQVATGVFDNAVDPALAAEFLGDSRHHIAVAIDDGTVVGFVSAVHYVHPDKVAELWVNEVGVAETHRRRGIARSLLDAVFRIGESLGCGEAWVLTSRNNDAALRLYQSMGGKEPGDETVYFTFELTATGGMGS